MASNMEEVVEDFQLDASSFDFYDEGSDVIQLYYKLKYPGTYQIPSGVILGLLDEETQFSHLQKSVLSYVSYFREMNKMDISLDSPASSAMISNLAANSRTILPKATKRADVFKVPRSASPSVYDSVHSINIPWRSCKNVKTFTRRQKSNTPKARKSLPGVGLLMCSEKSHALPLTKKYKRTYPVKKKNREVNMTLTKSDDEKMNNVIILDEN